MPTGVATNRTCVLANDDKWSGNFLNWAATQTIDPFRLVMTGGYRVRDELSLTVLQKANHPMTGSLYPNKSLNNAATIAGATPFAVSTLNMRVNGAGMDMLFTVRRHRANNAAVPATTQYDPPSHSSTRPSTASASRCRCATRRRPVVSRPTASSTAATGSPKA